MKIGDWLNSNVIWYNFLKYYVFFQRVKDPWRRTVCLCGLTENLKLRFISNLVRPYYIWCIGLYVCMHVHVCVCMCACVCACVCIPRDACTQGQLTEVKYSPPTMYIQELNSDPSPHA